MNNLYSNENNSDSELSYLEEITDIPEIIPDIGNIISDYTGGECDAKTNSGLQCWSYNQESNDCDNYCMENLDAWLLPIINHVYSYSDTIVYTNRDNSTTVKQLIDFKEKRFILSFYNHPFLKDITLYKEFRKIAHTRRIVFGGTITSDVPIWDTFNFTDEELIDSDVNNNTFYFQTDVFSQKNIYELAVFAKNVYEQIIIPTMAMSAEFFQRLKEKSIPIPKFTINMEYKMFNIFQPIKKLPSKNRMAPIPTIPQPPPRKIQIPNSHKLIQWVNNNLNILPVNENETVEELIEDIQEETNDQYIFGIPNLFNFEQVYFFTNVNSDFTLEAGVKSEIEVTV